MGMGLFRISAFAAHPKRFGALLLAGAIASVLAGLPGEILAKPGRPNVPAPATAKDQWGLTPRDWLTKRGPELRAAAGIPGSLPRVVAAAERGDVKAASLLAGAYSTGSGVERDYAQAVRWARFAADRNFPYGQFVLAAAFEQGNGVTKNPAEAERLIGLSADAGYVPAKFSFGSMLVIKSLLDWRNTSFLVGRRYVEDAAREGDRFALDWVRIWEIQDRFIDAATGMPIWKDGRGLVSGHAVHIWAVHPCVSDVRDGRGQSWRIAWNKTSTIGGTKGTVEFVGAIHMMPLDRVSRVFGFFEYEGASLNLARSRKNFSIIKETGDALYAECTRLLPG